MFKNMSERERKLAYIVLALVPLFVLFYVVTSYTSKYTDNRKRILSIGNQIEKEQDLQLSAFNAMRRREYYDRYSLPNDLNRTKIQYEGYLKKLTKECNLDITSYSSKNSGPNEVFYNGSRGRVKVFNQLTFELNGKGTLDQITEFLHRFYQLNMVQRISKLNINPILVGGSESTKFEREGPHRISMTIDVLSMVSAEPTREFDNEYLQVKKSLDEYNASILNRNMFGPANNAPQLSSGTKKSLTESQSPISYQISAVDKDKNDKLTFELLSTEIKDAKLEQPNPDSPRATFSCGVLPPGNYSFRVRVTDSGFPNKSTEEECVLTINKKREIVKVEPEDPVEPPPVRFAGVTQIRAIWGEKGKENIEIWIRPTDKKPVYQVGSTFQLDDKDWTIRKVNLREVQIECEGELLTYDLKGKHDILSSPLRREKILPAGASTTPNEPPTIRETTAKKPKHN